MSKAFKQGNVQSEQRLQATQIDQASLSGVYELVVGRQRKKKGVFSRRRQAVKAPCQRTD
jgi:hypothetical protein